MSRIHKTSGRPRSASGARPRILYITNSLPFPPFGGGQLREANLIQRLGHRADIDLRVLTENFGRDHDNVNEALKYCTSVGIYETNQWEGQRANPHLPTRLSKYYSAAFDAEVAALLDEGNFDLIHAEGYFIATHLPNRLRAPLVLVEENVEYKLDQERDQPWRQSREIELRMWNKATLVGSVAQSDLEVIREDVADSKSFYSPNGFDHIEDREPKDHLYSNDYFVTYVGNFGWGPTGDAGALLAKRIWPQVYHYLPHASLTLAGANIPTTLRGPGIHIASNVKSLEYIYGDTDVFACPTLTGSGVRVKMMEALSFGIPTICTDVALRGLPEEARNAVVVVDADDPDLFALKLAALLHSPQAKQELSERALKVASSFTTWHDAANILFENWGRAIQLARPIAVVTSRVRPEPQQIDALPAKPVTAKPATTQQKQVLIVVDTLLGYRTSMKYWSTIADDPRVSATLTFTDSEYAGGVRDAVMNSGLPVISIEEANSRKWDLGLFATDQGREYITAEMPKIKFPHGIGSPSKLYDGTNYAYNRSKLLANDGTSYYDLLIEPSQATADIALASLPELEGHLRVTGSLDVDELERTARRQNRLRKAFGFKSTDVVVLMSSTWNKEGLMLSHGKQLIEAAKQLPPNYKIVMTVHPNLLAKDSKKAEKWRARLGDLPRDRFRVCGPRESWMSYLAVADIALIDHSSIGLFFNSLRKPTIGVPISPDVLDLDSTIGQVLQGSPVFDPNLPLQPQLDNAISSFDPTALDEVRARVSSYAGEARSLVRGVFVEALGFDALQKDKSQRRRTLAVADEVDLHLELCELYSRAETLARNKLITRRNLKPKLENSDEAQEVLTRIAEIETAIGSDLPESTDSDARVLGARAAWAEECRRAELGASVLTGTKGHVIRSFWGRSVITHHDNSPEVPSTGIQLIA